MPHDHRPFSSAPAKQPQPITGRFVVIAFIAFFGVIASVNGVMMTLAIRTMPGLDVANGYVASQAMNAQIKAMRTQTQRGWSADLHVRLKNDTAVITVNLSDKSGQPLSGLAVSVRLAHPALTRADHDAKLIEQHPGLYVAPLTGIQQGAWTVVIEARQDGNNVFISHNRVLLSQARP